MGKARTLAVLAALLSGCAAGPEEMVSAASSAIAGGSPDPFDSAVVGVILEEPGSHRKRVCTGTLIAPDLVLTAQHCVADTAPFVDCASSEFGAPRPPHALSVSPSPSLFGEDARWTEAAEVITPPGGPFVCGRDVALLRLRAPLAVTPLLPRLDDGPRAADPYTAVGYGISGERRRDAGLRRRRGALSVLCVGEDCQSAQIAGDEWRGDHGICAGDSGGPALDAAGRVIGVTSRGPRSCEKPVYGGVAPHAPWIREAALRCAGLGGYAAPCWAREDEVFELGGGGGCAHAEARPERDGAIGIVALVGLLAARRRAKRRR